MAYDFDKLLKQTVTRRIPDADDATGMAFQSIDFAAILCDHEVGRVPARAKKTVLTVAEELRRVAEFYYKAALEEARRTAKPGRRLLMSDIAYIYAMAHLFESHLGLEPKFRKYVNARKGEIGGHEEANTFQRVCQVWMSVIDPKRPKPLTASSFKSAGERFKRRQWPKQ